MAELVRFATYRIRPQATSTTSDGDDTLGVGTHADVIDDRYCRSFGYIILLGCDSNRGIRVSLGRDKDRVRWWSPALGRWSRLGRDAVGSESMTPDVRVDTHAGWIVQLCIATIQLLRCASHVGLWVQCRRANLHGCAIDLDGDNTNRHRLLASHVSFVLG